MRDLTFACSIFDVEFFQKAVKVDRRYSTKYRVPENVNYISSIKCEKPLISIANKSNDFVKFSKHDMYT